MIKDFQKDESRLKFQEANSKKIKTLNTKWKDKIERIKENKFSSMIEISEIQNEILLKKKKMTEKLQEENREKKMNDLKRSQEKKKKALDSLHYKIENIINENESNRLLVQREINYRIKKITDRNKITLESRHHQLEDRLTNSYLNFKSNYNEIIEKINQKQKTAIEKPVEKYERWFIDRFEKNKENKEKKISKQKSKENNFLEIIDNLEEKRKIEEMKTIEKLKISEMITTRIKKEIEIKHRCKSQQIHKRIIQSIDKKKQQDSIRIRKEQDVLQRQIKSLSKARNIDEVFRESKSCIFDKLIVCQINTEKKMHLLNKQLYSAKNESLLKKNPDERKHIYKELKRKQEDEIKKKEKEENKKNCSD